MEYETSLEEPVDITIENTTNTDQAIRYYNVNFQDILKPGDSVKVTATTSESLSYYTHVKQSISGDKKELTPDDIAKIAFDYLNKEQGYHFISFERTETTEEYITYKYIDETSHTSIRMYIEDGNAVLSCATFKLWISKEGKVIDYQPIYH